MKFFQTLFCLLALNTAFSQNLDEEVLRQLMGVDGGSQSIQSLPVNMGGINPYHRLMLQDSLRSFQLKTESSVVDSMLLVYKDSLLQGPRSNDSLGDSIAFSSRRYIRNVFHGEKASLFSSVTGNVGGDYPLKAGDELQLVIHGEFEKVIDLKINSNGKVLVDGAGVISLNGLTLGEAENLVKQKLKQVHSTIRTGKTKVTLSLSKISPLKVFILGEVTQPGGYVFHGNTSALLALYFAQGPTENGSVRNVTIYRGKDSLKLDLYDFLFNGKRGSESVLIDGDVVVLPRAQTLVEMTGDVGRPGIYELTEGENVPDLIRYAGGANPSASNQPMNVRRFFPGGGLDIMTLKGFQEYQEGESFEFKNGDILYLPMSAEAPMNYFEIMGAVKYPNEYELSKGMRVKEAIELAGGPREDAYLDRVQIIRGKVDGSTELLSYSLADSASSNVVLQGRDTLIVFSQKEFFRADSVEISGAVMNPGKYEYFQNMTVKDLLLMAGGGKPFREKGKVRLERLGESKEDLQIFDLSTGEDYNAKDAQIVLYPKDRVVIPVSPEYKTQEVIKIRGAFNKPGDYSLLREGETLQSFMKRLGDLDDYAYLGGARFYRSTGEPDLLSVDTAKGREQLALDFVQALNGEERNNIRLQHGDSIFVPIKKVWVKIRGQVGSPSNVLYKPGEDIYYYISRAGGFTPKSDVGRVIITYANGEKMATDTGYEEPDPGSEIYVPEAAMEIPMDWLKFAQVVSNIFVSVTPVILSIMLLDAK